MKVCKEKNCSFIANCPELLESHVLEYHRPKMKSDPKPNDQKIVNPFALSKTSDEAISTAAPSKRKTRTEANGSDSESLSVPKVS